VSVYLLDTNTCVEYLRSRNAHVIQRIQSQPTQNIRLCSVVLGELFYGAFHSPNPVTNLALLRRFLSRFASLPFDDAAAEAYGDARASLRQLGIQIGPHDLQIAAIALGSGLTVVTHNVSEFSRVQGLTIEDWQT
jgi:tRNA(fMet)-specific endonuclease VapC